MVGVLGAFAIKVMQNPTSIGDDNIRALEQAGYSQDAIFECMVAASLASGLERIRAGLRALGETADVAD